MSLFEKLIVLEFHLELTTIEKFGGTTNEMDGYVIGCKKDWRAKLWATLMMT